MKTYDFDDSPVMRELERLEIAKNGIPECKIEKKASTDESDSLICKLSSLSKSLRKIGKHNEADSLDIKIVKYVTAENTHLYRAHDEDGEDLIDFAHSDGAVKVYDSKGGYGVVETQITQHKKIVDILNKQPTGKYASNSFLNEIASILKIANSNADIEKAKDNISDGNKIISKIVNKIDDSIIGSYSLIGNSLGFLMSSSGEIFWDTPKYREKSVAYPSKTEGTGYYKSGYGTLKKKDKWNLFVKYNPDAEKAAKEWVVSDLQIGQFWVKEVNKANENLALSLKNIIKVLNLIVSSNNIPEGDDQFIDFVDNQSKLLAQLENSTWLIDQIIDADEVFGIYIKGLSYIKDGIDKLKILKDKKEKEYFVLISNISKEISPELYKNGYNVKAFDNPGSDYKTLKKNFGFTHPEEFLNKLKKILSALKGDVTQKNSFVKNLITKKADVADELLKAIRENKKNTPSTTLPTQDRKNTIPSGKVETQPSIVSNRTRQQYVSDWKSKVDKQYVNSVDKMQSFLVNTLYPNAEVIFKSVIKEPGVTALINQLKETAAKDYRGDFDIDAQWGVGTSKAVEAAKKLLSMFPNNSGFENIKSGMDVNINGKVGYLYYAGYDADKQKEVANIASENLNIMNNILSANGFSGFSSTEKKSTDNVLDFIPKDTNMWADPSFLSLGISDRNPMPEGIPTAQITKQDLSNLINFDKWLKANDIISGGGMGALFSDGRLNYPAFKVLIYRIKTRAEAMVKNAGDAIKSKAEEYFLEASNLFTRLEDAWNSFKEMNPDANENKAVSPRALEMALLGGSPGIGSQTRPSQQGVSGANGEGSEGFDSTVNRRSRQDEIQIPVGYSIQPLYLQRHYRGTFENADELAPVIDIRTVKNIVSNPYGAYESIVSVRDVTWAQMLSDLRYSPNDNAVSSNGGVALKDLKGNTIKYINLSQNSATRIRISSEWKLKKLIEYLVSIQIGLRKVNKEYYTRIMNLTPGKEGLERATANNEAVIEWNQAIEYAITSIRKEISNLRTGKAKGFQI